MDCSKSGSRSTLLRWLEVLEKEFDKAFVDLDLILGEIDVDQMELTFEGRLKMTALSASFAQLVHKSQAIFQSNLRLEVLVLVTAGLLRSGNFRCAIIASFLCLFAARQASTDGPIDERLPSDGRSLSIEV
ncbi:unnamed protein product [Soboliphyme baturini]|uniref:SAM domain-containing protein n=1 Tax=Soboliphyme baturini TaxID=241478 RepID=A0A183IMX7_9BILA|nr:unnamed protein product [Soboliphyme baturini]